MGTGYTSRNKVKVLLDTHFAIRTRFEFNGTSRKAVLIISKINLDIGSNWAKLISQFILYKPLHNFCSIFNAFRDGADLDHRVPTLKCKQGKSKKLLANFLNTN